MEKLEKFRELGLSEETLKALKKKGFEEPSPIQALTIPVLLKGEVDVVGQAQTGTGKTAAFGLPMIEKLNDKSKAVQALVLTPTRELAIQVAEEINSLKGNRKIEVLPVYGGQSIDIQLKKLKKGVTIVVGTPGRVIDHLDRGTLDISNISYLILDEADEMLNMGFVDDVERILKSSNEDKSMLFFSATMPKEILTIAKKYMRKNMQIMEVKKEQLTTNLTDQIYFEVQERDKFEALCRIMDVESEFYGIVFCRTKLDVDEVTNKLMDRGYDAEGLHGDISQNQRERVLGKFKKKKINILVATDVAARGIDVNDLTHVINYSLPQDPESYVHRVGRTGRAGKEGTAITFVTPSEYRKLIFISKGARTEIRKEILPAIDEVITTKKTRIKAEVEEILSNESYEDSIEMAKELLGDKDPLKVIAAFIKHSYSDELDEKNYSSISEVNSASVDRTGTARLFVALGKLDGMTPKKLIEVINKDTGVDEKHMKDIKIFEKFSFVTTPFEEAEIIVNVFKKNKKGRKPLIEKAKAK
jgi:ATP-dependent RNA helicase DeaD